MLATLDFPIEIPVGDLSGFLRKKGGSLITDVESGRSNEKVAGN